jgi:hypothetical protein
MHLLAAADDLRPAVLIVWLAGSALAILVASLVQAPLLLLASKLARLPGVGFGQAWGSVLVCNVVFYGFLAVLALGTFVGLEGDGIRSGRGAYYLYMFAPVNFFYLFVTGVVGHALVFSPRLADPDEPAIGFGRATGVAVVYLGLCAVAASVVFVAYWAATAPGPK